MVQMLESSRALVVVFGKALATDWNQSAESSCNGSNKRLGFGFRDGSCKVLVTATVGIWDCSCHDSCKDSRLCNGSLVGMCERPWRRLRKKSLQFVDYKDLCSFNGNATVLQAVWCWGVRGLLLCNGSSIQIHEWSCDDTCEGTYDRYKTLRWFLQWLRRGFLKQIGCEDLRGLCDGSWGRFLLRNRSRISDGSCDGFCEGSCDRSDVEICDVS